jgi:AcrR family transcriptional regulator
MSREETIFGDAWPYSKAKTSLLRSASIVMRENGPRSATLKNIAGKAGVTEPAIFRHFDGVEGVFMSLFSVVELYFNRFAEFYKSDELVGLDRLESAYMSILSTLKSNVDFSYILVQPDPIFRQYAALRDQLAELRARDKASVVECIKEAKSKKQLQAGIDVESFAMSVVGSTMLLLQAWINNVDSFDLMKEGKKLWNGLKVMVADPNATPVVKSKPKAKSAAKKS